MWDLLHSELEITKKPYQGYKFIPLSKEKSISGFEADSGVKLPYSYKEFVKQFGAGEMADFYRIAAPLPIKHEYNLIEFNRQLHGEPHEKLLATYGGDETIDYFLFFSATGGDAFYGWNLKEVTNDQTNEYAIYEFSGFPPCRRIASNFQEFIYHYILEPDTSRNWTPEKLFTRFQIEK